MDQEEVVDKILKIFRRIIMSQACISIHPQVMSLCTLPFQTYKVVEAVIRPGMVQVFVNKSIAMEYLKLMTVLKVKNITVLPGLCRLIDLNENSVTEKVLEEVLTQIEFASLSTEILRSLVYKDTPAFNFLVTSLLLQLESPSEYIRGQSLKVLEQLLELIEKDEKTLDIHEFRTGKTRLPSYILEEFEDLVIGDLRKVVKKLLAIVLAEADGEFKESAHMTLVKIREKRPLALAYECIEAKKGGFLKRWEYLDTVLSLPC
jgi:hypothetical protein